MKVYAAINAVQKVLAVEGITKSRKNVQQGYSFRGIDDMFNAVSSLVAECGLTILPRYTERVQEERQTQKGSALFYTTVKGEFDFVSSEDGSKHTVVTYGEAMDTADKGTNKAMAAAIKYAIMQAFQIPTIGDNDADASTPDPIQRKDRKIDQPADEPRRSALVGGESVKTRDERSPLWNELFILLDKYGAKRPTFEKKISEALGVMSIGVLTDEQLPLAITKVLTHQAAAAKGKPGKKKADVPPPDKKPAPDLQQDDSDQDDRIPV